MKRIKAPSDAVNQAMELGILLARRQAFALIAGRCTAAQVDAMRRMRDGKLYLRAAAQLGRVLLECSEDDRPECELPDRIPK